MSATATVPVRNPAKIVEDLMKEWEENDMYDTNLWDCFREIFEDTDLTEEEFEKINKNKLRKLRKFLRQRGVWVYNGLNLPISRALLETVAENIRSTWSESEMKDCDFEEEFTSPAIRNFLKAERKRAEAAEAAKDRHGRENPRPPSRHGKEYSPTSPVAPYRKVPSVSPMQQQPSVRKSLPQPVQQVQTPPVQQVKPPPILQVQSSVESASASAPAPASAPIEPTPAPVEPALAPEPAPAPATAHLAAPLAAIPSQMPKPVLSFSVISEISILPVQSSPPQQLPRQPTASSSPALTSAPQPTVAPEAAPQQPPPPRPQRATYTAAPDPAFISAPILNPKTPQAAALLISPTSLHTATLYIESFLIASGCTFYKKGMG